MARLARANGGNTLAMLAAFLIPMSALTGSAVDIGRLYLVKARLQQACDAGVLAGRKFMIDTSLPVLDPVATAQARTFFANNFPSGIMGTPAFTTLTVPFTPTKTADNQVAGTATTTVPMTIMKMFGMPSRTLTVTCEARYDVADTDVIFVLDTTASMACAAAETGGCNPGTSTYIRPDGTGIGYYANEKPSSKIVALRSAVLNFFDTVANNKDDSTHVRYGFVTYTSTVNAGFAIRDLSSDYLVKSWSYNTRTINGDANNGIATPSTVFNIRKADCDGRAGRSPATGFLTDGTAVLATTSWARTSFTTGSNATGTCSISGQPLKPSWQYQSAPWDVSRFVAGDAVTDPSKVTGVTSRWQGCIEERDTRADTSFSLNNLPPDLDPDLVPYNDATRWRPMWPDVVYYRKTIAGDVYAGNGSSPYGDYWPKTRPPYSNADGATTAFTNMIPYAGNGWDTNIASGYVSCGKPVQTLKELNRYDVQNYVNAIDFKAQGGTYHDTGMIWGTRLISPTGVFAATTASWPGKQPPNRFIVFMTDGDMSPNDDLYGMYGIESYDRRVAGGTSGDYDSYLARHNARFLIECAAAKARNITVFVVGFGQALTPQLTQCASPGQAFYASDNASLTAAFTQIANQVAMLRISK